jgi:hypothetical protein
MHHVIGLAILIGTAAFVVFAFRHGLRVRRDRRSDDIPAMGMGSGSGPSDHSGSGFGHS